MGVRILDRNVTGPLPDRVVAVGFRRTASLLSQAHSSPSTSFTLIQRVKALDPEAWQTLSRLYGPLVYRWARKCGLGADEAADITQNVFVSVLRGISRFSLEGPDATFRGWLWTVTRNAVRENARKRSHDATAIGGSAAQHALHQVPDPIDEASLSEGEPAADEELATGLTHRAMEIVRESVLPHNWEAFWRTVVLEQPIDEVAQALQMTTTAVRQAKFRVLCKLRALLSDE